MTESHDHDHAHDHDHEHAPATRLPVSRRTAAAGGNYDPFARIFLPDGTMDRAYCDKRVPVLVDLLRRHPACYAARIDVELLGALLLKDDAASVRNADSEEAFEMALRAFSEHHLHELAPPELMKTLHGALVAIAKDPQMPRRERASAAIGIAILGGPPDLRGLRGRGVFDLLLRVTMEEQTAQEQMRKQARESEGGLSKEDLDAFWRAHPALRWRHEERYRREVTHVVTEIENGNLPIAISVDLALRGAAAILSAAAAARNAGQIIDSKEAERILHAPFVDDMLDGGPETVAARWRKESAGVEDLPSDERREYRRMLDTAIRLIEDSGPGADPVLFFAYARAVVQGNYFVRDQADLDAARNVFSATGLSAAGTVAYAKYLGGVDALAKRRILTAAVEIWPQDEGVRAAAAAMGDAEFAAAASERHGPRYDEEDDAEGKSDASDGEDGEGE